MKSPTVAAVGVACALLGMLGNFGNFGNYSNFATLASFPSESGPSDFRPPDYCLGWPRLGIESLGQPKQ